MVCFELGKEIEKDVFFVLSEQYAGRVSYELRNRPRSSVESLWLSGRASEHGIRRFEVPFLIGLRIFSLSHARNKTKRHLSLI